MTGFWNAIGQRILSSAPEYAVIFSLVVGAAIKWMPERFPGHQLDVWWQWIRNALQEAANQRRPSPPPDPTQPNQKGTP